MKKMLSFLLCFTLFFAAFGCKAGEADAPEPGDPMVPLSDCVPVMAYAVPSRPESPDYDVPSEQNAAQVSVLLYHHILPDHHREAHFPDNASTTSESEFIRQMQLIRDEGYTVVTLDDVVAYVKGEKTLPEKSVAITFDDGYKSNINFASPILREYGYPASVFLLTAFLDRPYEEYYRVDALQYITYQDLAKAVDVFSYECHTHRNHRNLNELTYAQITADLTMSRVALMTKYFAYPHGKAKPYIKRAVRNMGFEAAFTTEPAPCTVGMELDSLPRYSIRYPLDDATFLSYLTGELRS